jgi:CBS domain containing-hemolysin-like protein
MIGAAATIGVLCLLLMLVSYCDRVYTEMGKFLAREFQDNIDNFEKLVEPRLGVSHERAVLSMALLSQLTLAAIALLLGYHVFIDGHWDAAEIAEAAVEIVLIAVVFNRLLPYVLFSRTQGRWPAKLVLFLRLLMYLALPVTVVLGFAQSVASLAQPHAPEEPETPAEAVDALIEAGEEEGILQASDRELIQSVVEFGEKTVREVMTPRPEVVAVPTTATVEQFIELQRTKPYSRVPVYEGSIDNIKGVVFAHDVLQMPDSEAKTRTVETLIKPVLFVPESKRVSKLLRELQRQHEHMAIVSDEYGTVAGVVTIEDLVEEIVGEIRDEHEAKADVVRESDRSYVVPGNMDVGRLEDLFGIRPEGHEATTVAGLVSEILGHIPGIGETFEAEGLKYEVLASTDRRVERLRISVRQRRKPETVRA